MGLAGTRSGVASLKKKTVKLLIPITRVDPNKGKPRRLVALATFDSQFVFFVLAVHPGEYSCTNEAELQNFNKG